MLYVVSMLREAEQVRALPQGTRLLVLTAGGQKPLTLSDGLLYGLNWADPKKGDDVEWVLSHYGPLEIHDYQ